MSRPRIKSVEQRLIKNYRALGMTTKQAWAKLNLVTLESNLNYIAL